MKFSDTNDCVILSVAAFQAERRISRGILLSLKSRYVLDMKR